jgi:hypothetical protein
LVVVSIKILATKGKKEKMYSVSLARDDRMQRRWNAIAWLVILTMLIFSAGCASMFTAGTTVDYESTGVKAHYTSHKNQENFKAHVTFDENGKINGFNIETNATTPEAAIAASAAAILKALDLAQMALNAAPKGPVSFTPVPAPTMPIYDCGLYVRQCQREKYIPERVPVLQWE